jgi:hypothetical protein
MSIHHIQKSVIQRHICIYCNKNLNAKEWVPQFYGPKQYITTVCDCGREVYFDTHNSETIESFKKTCLENKLR